MTLSFCDIEKQAASGDGAAQVLLARRLETAGQRQGAETWLRRAAAAGNLEGMTALGKLLLSSASVTAATMAEGRKLLHDAADAGHGDAAHFLALITAIDSSITNNWMLALDHLGRAAEAGHSPARTELALLAGAAAPSDENDGTSPGRWQKLRASIDLATMMAVPKPEIVSTAPFIASVKRFASPEFCDWLIASARPRLTRAQTYNPTDGQPIANHSAASPELNLVLLSALQRIAAVTGVAINGQERTSVLHYEVGDDFKPHYDFLDPAMPAFAAEIQKTGQRIFTFLLYLNDDYEGGETEFPLVSRRFKGRKGDAICFRNVGGTGTPDFQALHAGLPPTRGEKWLFARTCTYIPPQPAR
jgi:hypothetical protein